MTQVPVEDNNQKEKVKTFSAQVRDYIMKEYSFDKSQQRLLFLAFASVSFKDQGRSLRFATYSFDLVHFIERIISEEYHGRVRIVKHKEMITCTLSEKRLLTQLNSDLEQFFLNNPANFSTALTEEEIYLTVKAVLSGLYLGCGVIANPKERYDLEFAIPKRSTSLWYGLFLSEIDLEPGRIVHQGSELLYLKDGEKIADFLRYIGADQLLLEFETVRVQKDMRNRINRIVNCDNANAQRIANTVAKQIQDIQLIKSLKKWGELPDPVKDIGDLRIEYPEYSLKELSEMTNPPLGKSGVNHRLKKIEKFAEELRAKNNNLEN